MISEFGMLTFRTWILFYNHTAGNGQIFKELAFHFHSWDKIFPSFEKRIQNASLKASENVYFLALNYSNQMISLFKIEKNIEKLIFTENINVVDLEISDSGQKLVAILDGGFGVWSFSDNNVNNFQKIKTERALTNIKILKSEETILTFDDDSGNVCSWSDDKNGGWEIRNKYPRVGSVNNFAIDPNEEMLFVVDGEDGNFLNPLDLEKLDIRIETVY